jgi:beta-1,4-mannosyltransferase
VSSLFRFSHPSKPFILKLEGKKLFFTIAPHNIFIILPRKRYTRYTGLLLSSCNSTRLQLFRKLQPVLENQKVLDDFLPLSSVPYSTAFTRAMSKPSTDILQEGLPPFSGPSIYAYSDTPTPSLRPDRPALLVSSTSWTPDEDFEILIDSLGMYETRAEELASQKVAASLPKMLVVVTGKGPLKAKYMADVDRLQRGWKWVRFISLWLEAEDYPIFLGLFCLFPLFEVIVQHKSPGSADLGVCLHSSSSSLDLPMKIVDMFGCGLPVCALDFTWYANSDLSNNLTQTTSSLHELVNDGENGRIFKTAPQLATQLEVHLIFFCIILNSHDFVVKTLLAGFPNSPSLRKLASSLERAPATPNPHVSTNHGSQEPQMWCTWEENWGRVMRPLILHDVNF